MLTRKRVNRYPFSLRLFPKTLTASVLPLRTICFGELILLMWTSSRPRINSFNRSRGASVAAMTPGCPCMGAALSLPPFLQRVLLPIVEQQVKEVEVRCSRSPIHPFLDDGKGLVERLAHAGIVGSLSGKDQSERRHRRSPGGGEKALRRT